jgi:RNA polymerase sigma-70 factor (ECF subfamily)
MGLEPEVVVQALLRERPRLIAVAAAVVRDAHAADDVFQQVVLAALQHPAHFCDTRHVLAWGLRTARHRALNAAKRKGVRTLSDAALARLEAGWSDPAGEPVSDHAEALRLCLDTLVGPVREAVRLRYDRGLTVTAIAGRLGRTPEAVYQTLSRAHRALRGCVERRLGRPAPTVGM